MKSKDGVSELFRTMSSKLLQRKDVQPEALARIMHWLDIVRHTEWVRPRTQYHGQDVFVQMIGALLNYQRSIWNYPPRHHGQGSSGMQ